MKHKVLPGMDLRAAEDAVLKPGSRCLMPTGFAIALPSQFEAQVRPRSGLAVKHGVTVLNAPGTIDSDYRGEIKVPLINHGTDEFHHQARRQHCPDDCRSRCRRQHLTRLQLLMTRRVARWLWLIGSWLMALSLGRA